MNCRRKVLPKKVELYVRDYFTFRNNGMDWSSGRPTNNVLRFITEEDVVLYRGMPVGQDPSLCNSWTTHLGWASHYASMTPLRYGHSGEVRMMKCKRDDLLSFTIYAPSQQGEVIVDTSSPVFTELFNNSEVVEPVELKEEDKMKYHNSLTYSH